ncbi:hypothetical protein [Jiella sonneratiae]|uniref:Uncharacterized protein n=1 Tax=Jiella sonneratiae TaxID=2816856 RepID=A0ABS3IY41_9HYPH|nr:hypothetical protein [Jiella sonneratiae]MBO0902331.1 hypothetical protein [Jiella sonneratiae]
MSRNISKFALVLSAGAVLGLTALPAMAAGHHRMTTLRSAPMSYGYAGDETTAAQPRCENVEAHYSHYPKASSMARNGNTLVPGDATLGQENAWQTDLAIASSPVCRQ